MLKFIRGKGQPPLAERQRLQRELFAFRKTVHHGFPNKPTAISYDSEMKLLALATANGTLKVYGKPGVEFYGHHKHSNVQVTRVLFVPNTGRIITVCANNSLHLWEISEGFCKQVKSQILEGKLKTISSLIVDFHAKFLLIGTEGGNVYYLKLSTFKMSASIIYLDVILQRLPSKQPASNPGAVEALSEQPGIPDHILLGYTRGLVVLWSREERCPLQIYFNTQQVESFCWDMVGRKFIIAHNDGSYAFWDIEKTDKPIDEPTTLYGPFPCKPITKIIWKQIGDVELLIFGGGMPRASYNEKYTISVYGNNGKTHSVLDFTSRVIDFIYVEPDNVAEVGMLLVLAEEELVAVDLSTDDMKMIPLPYLASLHASAVTCSYHASNIPPVFLDVLEECGYRQAKHIHSNKKWPTLGGKLLSAQDSERNELLLTGHEDGTVRFWDCSGIALTPLYKFSTALFFTSDTPASPSEEEEEWPPFKKIGTFDPYSDDPRLAVRRVWLCPRTGTLVVAGAAGHVIVATIETEPREISQIPVRTMNIVSDRDNFVWKGHEALTHAKESTVIQPAGLQVSSILQLHPPAGITALCCSTELGLVGVGTAHGLALYDYFRMTPVITKCTLNPNDLSGAGDAPISRRKSFKKSLRESFRRLRRGRSTRATGDERPGPASPGGHSLRPVAETRPIERQIEARPVDDTLGSMVRCVHIATTFLTSTETPTFWVGTNNGTIYAFTITMPPRPKRREADVISQLGKEIQLKHRAPVLSVTVVDGNGLPVEGNSPSPHRVLICSEEQFKIFTLPGLKPLCKLKLTAHEGCRVRKTSFAKFKTADGKTSETCLLCLTNLGECFVLSVPEFRRHLNSAVIPPEDINGITSLTFTSQGEAFYLHSSSEFQRITLSATKVTALNCKIDVPHYRRVSWQKEEEICLGIPARDDRKKIAKDDRKKTVNDDSKNTVKDESNNTVIDESNNAVKDESNNAVKDESENTVKDDNENTVKDESNNAVKDDNESTVKDESNNAVKDDSKNTVKDDHKKTGKDGHKRTGKDDHRRTGKGEHKRSGKDEHKRSGKDEHKRSGKDEHKRSGKDEHKRSGKDERKKTVKEEPKLKESEDANVEGDQKEEKKEGASNDDEPEMNDSVNDAEKALENGIFDERHELSVGDITIDSVKDHLASSNQSLSDVTHDESKASVKTQTDTVTESNVTSEMELDLGHNLGIDMNLLGDVKNSASDQISEEGEAPLASMEDLD